MTYREKLRAAINQIELALEDVETEKTLGSLSHVATAVRLLRQAQEIAEGDRAKAQ